ncbi:hypothetical protein [Candidatus Clostridium stratigraminis]|uniref:Uncharacterized protein n=1 Tax=Candidatus Clostridium stratigraminis TaxID=3381661 RepID=A0ABW8T1A3_9CLOT
MKLKKKTVMLLSFTVGTLMFATTALADVASKSGYDQIKDALKFTAESYSSKLSSYTMDVSFVMKDNDKNLSSLNEVIKVDIKKGAREDVSTNINYNNQKVEGYNYTDKNSFIYYNSNQKVYYVNDLDGTNSQVAMSNPFKENSAGDFEKIADALTANLKDYVEVTSRTDGGKILSGSLSEAQIPALVNAVTSFEFKNTYGGYYAAKAGADPGKATKITSDIFVKDVAGKINVDKNGLIESILASGTLSGKDDKGAVHIITFDLLGKLQNVNSTVISKPDLTGKKVEKVSNSKMQNKPNYKNYIGQYKGDIIIDKDGKLVKIGERIFDIESSDDKSFTGRYHEEYRKGYEEYAANRKDFKLTANFDKDPYNPSFNYTNSDGKSIKGQIGITPYGARLYINFNEPSKGNIILDDLSLYKVFD